MSKTSGSRPRRPAPSRGRPRVPDPKTVPISVRCTAKDHAVIKEAAAKAGYTVGPYLRNLALGSPGPRSVRRPSVEKEELGRLLGHIGKLGSNVNQIARAVNTTRNLPSWSELAEIRHEVSRMRDALMKALGHDH